MRFVPLRWAHFDYAVNGRDNTVTAVTGGEQRFYSFRHREPSRLSLGRQAAVAKPLPMRRIGRCSARRTKTSDLLDLAILLLAWWEVQAQWTKSDS